MCICVHFLTLSLSLSLYIYIYKYLGHELSPMYIFIHTVYIISVFSNIRLSSTLLEYHTVVAEYSMNKTRRKLPRLNTVFLNCELEAVSATVLTNFSVFMSLSYIISSALSHTMRWK